MPDENKKKLVDIITKHNIPLIEDDIYGELYFGKNRPKTCKYFDKKGLVMHCSSLSKSLAPGYRIGWAIPGKFFEQVKQIKSGYITSVALTYTGGHGTFFKEWSLRISFKKSAKSLAYTMPYAICRQLLNIFRLIQKYQDHMAVLYCGLS